LITRRGFAAVGTVLLTAFVLADVVKAQQVLSPPPGAKTTTVTPRAGFFNEPSVAINPKNPDQVVLAFQSPAKAAYSDDAGEHWQLATGAAPTNYNVSGDVSITYDVLGHAILCYIAFDKLGTPQYWAHNATRNGIFVRRSLDGGKTWESNAASVDEQPTHPDMPFEDKPFIVADNNPYSPFAGNLYVGWTEFSLSKSIILFSRSTDGGITWSAPYEISTHEGVPRDDNGAVEGFSAVAGPDGTLYTIWDDGGSIVMATSRDGGLTFSTSEKIIDTPASYFKVEAVERSDGFPQIGMDPRTERLYVVWTDYRNGDVDVFCSTSRDRGRTWSIPVRVNNDAVHDGADQFFQWLAVDPMSGAAYVVFYDRRNDPENRNAIIVLARSTDGGQTFANYAWTEAPFDPGDQFIGDYTGIAAFNDRVYGAWAYKEAPARSASQKSASTEHRAQAPRLSPRSPVTIVQVGEANFHSEAGKPQ
jgi:BNR/Asp-box repeat